MPQVLGEPQIAAQRVEHVLPRTHGLRVADPKWLTGLDRPDRVREQPVLAPVAAADHVAGAGGRERGGAVAGEERRPVGRGDELGACLRARIGIISAEGIALDEPLGGQAGILVALV